MERVLFNNPYYYKQFWVGLRDRNGEGKYRYVDDNSLLNNDTLDTRILSWGDNNYYGNAGHCVGITGPYMHNLDCSLQLLGLCEKKYFSE